MKRGDERLQLALQTFVAAFLLLVPGCSPEHGTHPAAAPQTLTAPLLPQPFVPFATVDGPTPYTAAWVGALRCWGAEDYYPEPAVQVVPCPLTDAQGQGGFRAAGKKCAGSPTGYCYGTIEGGAVKICGDGAGVAHEYAHASHWSLFGDFGADCELAPRGSVCCSGVAR